MSEKRLIERKGRNQDSDNPERTKEDFARARPASEIHGHLIASGLVRKRGRPPKPEDERKKQVTLRLSQDVLSAARKTGPGWQGRVDDVLRAAFTANRSISVADLGAAIVKSAKGDRSRATSRMVGRDHKKRA